MTTSKKKRIIAICLAFILVVCNVFVLTPMDVSAASNVKIGQATSGEGGKTRGGSAGDQTGKEVATTSWTYSSKKGNYNNWKYVFRAKDPAKAQLLANLMVAACKNNNIGYDQKSPDRFSLYDAAKKIGWNISGVTTKCETTCSSVVSVCLNAAGFSAPRYWDASIIYKDLKSNAAFYTFTDPEHCSKDTKLEPGDILVSPGAHTAMVVTSPNRSGKEKGGLAIATGPSQLKAASVRQPGTIVQGKGFSVAGVVESNYWLTSVTVSIIDKSGKEVIAATAKPMVNTYSLGCLDSAVKFGALAPGSYRFRISGSDEKRGNAVLHENSFEVVPVSEADKVVSAQAVNPQSSLKASGLTQPEKLTQGKGFSVKGTVTSNKTISAVNAIIMTTAGKELYSATAKPNATSYDLSKLDSSMKFSKLANGTYRYVVIASDSIQTLVLLDKTFTVSGTAAPAKPAASAAPAAPAPVKTTAATISYVKKGSISVSSARVPSVIKYKGAFTAWGTIKANKKIKNVKVIVTNSSGKTKLSASSKPYKKSYNFKKLDKKLKYGKLSKGSYKFIVKARTSSSGWKTLISYGFTVK